MAAARGKLIDVVLTTKLDRFMGNTRLLLDYVDQLKALRVAYVACEDNIDTSDTKTGSLMLTILAAVAQWERERIEENK